MCGKCNRCDRECGWRERIESSLTCQRLIGVNRGTSEVISAHLEAGSSGKSTGRAAPGAAAKLLRQKIPTAFGGEPESDVNLSRSQIFVGDGEMHHDEDEPHI